MILNDVEGNVIDANEVLIIWKELKKVETFRMFRRNLIEHTPELHVHFKNGRGYYMSYAGVGNLMTDYTNLKNVLNSRSE